MRTPLSTSRRIVATMMLLSSLCALALPAAASAAADPLRIGVLAFRPKAQTIEQWKPLVAALKKAIPDREFILEAFNFPELDSLVSARKLDFVLTNPGHLVLLMRRSGMSAPLATMVLNEHGRKLAGFGGVIFTRSDNAAIKSLNDIKGTTIAVTGTTSFGGYQTQALELHKIGIELPQDATLFVTGMPHDNVIEAVLNGNADVGFVRTSVLEGMVRESKLRMKQITVLNPQSVPDFSLQLSTRLYPEWPFAVMPEVDKNLARRIAAVLFLIEEDTAATRAMGIQGFTVPADYSGVEDLLRDLRLPPFNAAPAFTLQDVTNRYRWQILGGLIISGLIVLLIVRLHLVNRKLDNEKRIVLGQQDKLQDSEKQYRQLFDQMLSGLMVCEVICDESGTPCDHRLINGNLAFEKLTGLLVREQVGRTSKDLGVQWPQEVVQSLYNVAMTGEPIEYSGFNESLGKFYETRVFSPRTGQFALVFTDINERKKAETALREAQILQSVIVDSTADLIWSVDVERYGLLTFNKALTEHFVRQGIRITRGLRPEDLFPPGEAVRVWHNFYERALREGSYTVEYAVFSGDLVLELTFHVLGKEHATFGVSVFGKNITERKKSEENLRYIEERLRQSEKMEAVGQLAGGIAHDFNNVLGGIIGFTDLSLNHVEKNSVLEKNLLKVLKAADRAKHLVKQILAFSRQSNPQKSITSIRPIIKEVMELLKSSIPSSVNIESDLRKNTKPVLADPTQIHQVLLNLSTNSVQAMNRKGTLTVKLYPASIGHVEHGQSGDIAPGEYTIIEVADDGCGMDAATLSKAFEPFFTTKAIGEGTGMGLSVVLGIVQSHGGDLQIESAVGKGTLIRIYLPVIDASMSESTSDDTNNHQTGTERILFLDDEAMLVDMAENILTPLGYTVIGMSNSVDAMEFIQKKSRDIDIIVTDQTMPGMTGVELAKEALKIRNDIPIIVCTGFSSEINAEQAAQIGIARLLMKPYGTNEICKLIRDVLDYTKKEQFGG